MEERTTELKAKLKEVTFPWRRGQEPPTWKSETAAEAAAYPMRKVVHGVKLHTAKGLWIPAYKRDFKKPFQQLQFRVALLCWHVRL